MWQWEKRLEQFWLTLPLLPSLSSSPSSPPSQLARKETTLLFSYFSLSILFANPNWMCPFYNCVALLFVFLSPSIFMVQYFQHVWTSRHSSCLIISIIRKFHHSVIKNCVNFLTMLYWYNKLNFMINFFIMLWKIKTEYVLCMFIVLAGTICGFNFLVNQICARIHSVQHPWIPWKDEIVLEFYMS